MDKQLKLNLRIPIDQIGSSKYTVQLEITNLADSRIFLDEIVPDIIPGQVLSKNQTGNASEIDSLEFEKKEIVEELELQLAKAYEKQMIRKMRLVDRIIYTYAAMPELIASFITKTKPTLAFPSWSKKAFSIKEWGDVTQLEEIIMVTEKDDSLLKKAFLVNKNKLSRIIVKLDSNGHKKQQEISLKSAYILNPKESINIPFHCRAPHLYKSKEFDVLFNLKFRIEHHQNVFNQSISDKIKFKSSGFATPVGSALGGVLGFLIKLIFVTKGPWFNTQFWTFLMGSLIIAIVLGLFTNNSSDSKKIFAVEGFTGGIILGVMAGLFTEEIIEYFKKFLPQ